MLTAQRIKRKLAGCTVAITLLTPLLNDTEGLEEEIKKKEA